MGSAAAREKFPRGKGAALRPPGGAGVVPREVLVGFGHPLYGFRRPEPLAARSPA